MSEILPSSVGTQTAAPSVQQIVAAVAAPQPKAIDLAVLKKGTKDFLDFADDTKEIFYAYLYHRTGSAKLANTLLSEIYMDVLSKALSLWWFGKLRMTMLLERAEEAISRQKGTEADLDTLYIPTLTWLSEAERKSVSSLHDGLWTLQAEAQRLLILSLLVGLSDERIAEILSVKADLVTKKLAQAKELLLSRWQPIAGLETKLGSLVFEPSLSIADETNLRFALVEKYNSLRMRRYQWVVIGGLFAVMSNVIVASVLAFAVIVQPPTSMRGTKSQVASLDAVLLKRQMELSDSKRAMQATFQESQRIAAFSVSRDVTALGLASALEALKSQQEQEAEANRLIKLLRRADTAIETLIIKPIEVAIEYLLQIF